jgi:glycerol-3-phosphate dehydrogenase
MAERIVDHVMEKLDMAVTRSETGDTPLPGGDADMTALRNAEAFANRPCEAVSRLINLYGTEAVDVAAWGGDVGAEVEQAVLREGALTLEDYWVRRSARAWFDEGAGLSILEPAAAAMARQHGWSEERKRNEIESCRAVHERSMACLKR